MTKDDGGPAFPQLQEYAYEGSMSLRDYFAAKAMIGLLSGEECPCGRTNKDGEIFETWIQAVARQSYEFADAILKERSK